MGRPGAEPTPVSGFPHATVQLFRLAFFVPLGSHEMEELLGRGRTGATQSAGPCIFGSEWRTTWVASGEFNSNCALLQLGEQGSRNKCPCGNHDSYEGADYPAKVTSRFLTDRLQTSFSPFRILPDLRTDAANVFAHLCANVADLITNPADFIALQPQLGLDLSDIADEVINSSFQSCQSAVF